MKKIFTLIILLSAFLSTPAYSQIQHKKGEKDEKKSLVKWKINPFNHRLFIENKGQFDGSIPEKDKILYGAQIGFIRAYFTAKGVTFKYTVMPKVKPEKGKDPDEDKTIKPKVYYVSYTWQNGAPNTAIEAAGELSYPYLYAEGNNQTIKTSIFKKITYKDIYPGIDIEYIFPEGKDGIEYSIIAHPGADISKVKLKYSGTDQLNSIANGDITFNSKIGLFIDHAPVAYYKDTNISVPVSYTVNGSTESFSVATYHKTKTLVIDPWTSNPSFGTGLSDKAYDLDWDNQGNVYALGSDSPYQLTKLDNTGAIIWTTNVNLPGEYGDFGVDKVTGTSYVTSGGNGSFQVRKINTNAVLVATYTGTTRMEEYWRADFDNCNRDLVIAGGETGTPAVQGAILDSNMTTMTYVNSFNLNQHTDMSLLALDPDGKHCYMASNWDGADPIENEFVQIPVPALAPYTYIASDHNTFFEHGSTNYTYDPATTEGNGMNGAAASPNWLYLYDSDTLQRFNKNTGVFNALYPVRSGPNAAFYRNFGTTVYTVLWGGIDVDRSNYIYMGVADSLYVMDSTFTMISKIPLPDTVFDVHVGENSNLYACGSGFVTQLVNPAPGTIVSTTSSPTTCSACNGSASAKINWGSSKLSYKWSNGATTQTATGLCAAIYSVTITDSSYCPASTYSAVVNVSSQGGYTASVRDTDIDCKHTQGKSTISPSGGSSPYTYTWSNGQTNQTATGLSAGTYSCTVTDHNGCNFYTQTTIVVASPPRILLYPSIDTMCLGSSVAIAASGLQTYNWAPGTGLSCTNCSTPTSHPTTPAVYTYTVSGVDSNGCSASATSTLDVKNAPQPVITGKDSVCHGTPDTLVVTGGITYTWSTGTTSDTLIKAPNVTRIYSVTANDALCPVTVSFTVNVVGVPVAQITPSSTAVCPGDSVQLSAFGGTTYKWNTGQTATSIWVHPTVQTTYTLHAVNFICADSTTTSISINAEPAATISATPDTICNTGTSTLSVNVTQGGPATYKWSNQSTAASTTVSPSATATYSVTIYGQCDSLKLTKTVTVLPPPVVNLAAFDTICAGDSITLTANGGGTYLWSNNATTSSIRVWPTSNTTYSVTVTKGCTSTATAAVAIDIPAVHVCCDDSIGMGNSVQLKATGASTYAWDPSTGLSCSTCANPLASPSVTTTYTINGYDNRGCYATDEVTVRVGTSPCTDFTVPNVFTPNNDGINDDFVINMLNPSSYNISIFDRWGKQVYTSSNINDYWNGRINGSENLAPDGTYYYVISGSCGSNDYIHKGFVELAGEK